MGRHVTVEAARKLPLQLRLTRAGYCGSVAALLLFFGCQGLQNAGAEGETRTISLHHIHTNEDLTITYKVNGRYDDAALAKLNNLLRDWREEQPTAMDPHVIDLLWEVHREMGAKGPIWIVCGYRSPTTNASLRKRSSGVAKHSQHMQGKAIDFHIPGVPLEELRAAGLRAQRGGVGFYPGSGFVHLDTGGVRHWPRVPEAQLAKILAKGQLASHLASDAKGTAIARGDIQRSSAKPSLLARLFGAKDDEEETASAQASVAATGGKAEPNAQNKAEPKPQKPAQVAGSTKLAAVPVPVARPQSYQLASADTKLIVPTTAQAEVVSSFAAAAEEVSSIPPVRVAEATTVPAGSQSATDVISARGFWQGTPKTEPAEVSHGAAEQRLPPAPPSSARRPSNAEAKTSAGATPWPVGDRGEPLPNALSYAAQPTPIAAARALPMGTMTRRPHADTTVVTKRTEERAPAETTSKIEEPVRESNGKVAKIGGAVRVGDRFDDPWMRAMIVSPSAQGYMKTTLLGAPDFRHLGPYLHKPTAAPPPLSFSKDDPYLGMSTEKFSGAAVMFMSSMAAPPRTATR
jgi:uncharacterized protein YcbK (DUF882 family)